MTQLVLRPSRGLTSRLRTSLPCSRASQSPLALLQICSQQQTRQLTVPPPSSPPKHSRRDLNTLDNNVTKEEQEHYDNLIADDKNKQIRTPWHREGSDKPPVSRARSAGAMTKGKLLTTPTRLFKLVLPLVTTDKNSDRKDVEPLALLVHPQQPLSYLERLIQSELPLLKGEDGKDKIPTVHFRAEDSMQDDARPGSRKHAEEEEEEANEHEHSSDEATSSTKDIKSKTKQQESTLTKTDGEDDPSHTHLRPHDPESAAKLRGGPGEGGVESYSGLGRENPNDTSSTAHFVRWSKSTEIGDFVRDAARGKEFAVEIEGAPKEIRVGVPSFGDRTYYLRMRLRKKSKEISAMADIKHECDELAERAGQRILYAGFGSMVGWGGLVYYLTFKTELGWDVMEPVTYLVGLGGFVGGYAWFLLNKREASYRSAMHLTISRRQNKLYQSKGFDIRRWEYLMEEANVLRKEIIAIAQEYDVEYVEERDAKDEKVLEALKEHRHKKKREKGGKEDDESEEGDDDGPKKFEGARG